MRTAIVIATGFTCTLGGCQPHSSRSEPWTAPTAESVTFVPTMVQSSSGADTFDLSGGWATGTGTEPAVAKITLQPGCNHTPAAWYLNQSGDSVQAWLSPASIAQGVAQRDVQRPVMATGKISGVTIVLDDDASHYRLRYDSASGHLRGTLNGQPFWAVRQEIVRPEHCIPPP